MTRTRLLFLLAVSLLILAGCNMPLPGTSPEPTSASLRGQVSVPTEFRAGPGDVYDLLGVLLSRAGVRRGGPQCRRESTCSYKIRPTQQ